ncbi:MAG: hypothetical protein M0Z30_24425 [Actinomycetota bacterium]|nr:hypothetical protein [Actinomycetota bacterium]
MTTDEKTVSDKPRYDEKSVFGDVEAKVRQAVAEAVADRRSRGLAIAVDRGHGVELIA